MRRLWIAVAVFLSLLGFVNGGHAAPVPYLDVTARIDHEDSFVMRGNQWFWHHFGNYAVPEVHSVITPTVIDSSFLGGPQSFLSTWPGAPVPTPVSYAPWAAMDSNLNTVAGLAAIEDVIDLARGITLEQLAGRNAILLEQVPSAGNAFTLKAKFTDFQGGSDIYRFRILGEPRPSSVPEPSILLVAGCGLVTMVLLGRRITA